MPRKFVPQQTQWPIHITARTVNREPFKIPLPDVWEIMQDRLFFLHHAYEIKIHAFVLMPNHYHLIATDHIGNISKGLNYFMRDSSLAISEKAGRINQVYGARNYKCIIDSHHYFSHAYKYLHRNPVKAGLAERVEDYPFSTLHGLLGKSQIIIPTVVDTLLFRSSDPSDCLCWLNQSPIKQHEEAVRLALRRTVFSLPRDKNNHLHPLETGQF